MNNSDLKKEIQKIEGLISIEVECLVHNNKREVLSQFCRDNNIIEGGDPSLNTLGWGINYNTREIKLCKYKIKEVDKLFNDLKELFKIVKTNKSCGLHIHLSFKNKTTYYKLFAWDFVEKFQKEYLKNFTEPIEVERTTSRWSRFYRDLKDFEKSTNIQLLRMSKTSERYKSVNFNSFNIHNTIEFRIFTGTHNISKFKEVYFFLFKNVIPFTKKNFDLNKFEVEVENKPSKKQKVIREVIKVEVGV